MQNKSSEREAGGRWPPNASPCSLPRGRPHSLPPWVLIPGRVQGELAQGWGGRGEGMKALRCRGDLPATSSGGQPPPAPSPPSWSPAGLPKPRLCQRGRSPSWPPTPTTLLLKQEQAGVAARGSEPPPAQLGPVWKGPPRLGGRRSPPPRQAPRCAGAGGPRGGGWGRARLPSGGKFWVWVPSSWAHTAHAPSPCGGETQKVRKSPFPGPSPRCPPRRPVPPARRPSRAPAPPAPQTHFCSKAAMSLESRMFSSGSQVLYLPSHTRKTRMRTGEAAAHARGKT